MADPLCQTKCKKVHHKRKRKGRRQHSVLWLNQLSSSSTRRKAKKPCVRHLPTRICRITVTSLSHLSLTPTAAGGNYAFRRSDKITLWGDEASRQVLFIWGLYPDAVKETQKQHPGKQTASLANWIRAVQNRSNPTVLRVVISKFKQLYFMSGCSH